MGIIDRHSVVSNFFFRDIYRVSISPKTSYGQSTGTFILT